MRKLLLLAAIMAFTNNSYSQDESSTQSSRQVHNKLEDDMFTRMLGDKAIKNAKSLEAKIVDRLISKIKLNLNQLGITIIKDGSKYSNEVGGSKSFFMELDDGELCRGILTPHVILNRITCATTNGTIRFLHVYMDGSIKIIDK